MRKVLAKVGVLGLLLMLGLASGPEQKVVFLDVGQGESILIQDGWTQVLVDGGPGMKVLEELGEQMPYWDRKVEVVMLTHPQQDHMEGLLHVLDRYDVGLVIIPRVATDTLLQKEWLKRIQDKGITWRFAWAGQRIVTGEMEINILAPFTDVGAVNNVNDAAVVARVDIGNKQMRNKNLSFLLTADAEKKEESRLISRIKPEMMDVDVLKVGHHGSKTSTTPALLGAVLPQAAVVSVGVNNKFGHPTQEVLDRLKDIPVWRTDEDGAVTFAYVKDGWVVKGER